MTVQNFMRRALHLPHFQNGPGENREEDAAPAQCSVDGDVLVARRS